MRKDLLERAKREYLETPVPEYLKYNGWSDLRVKLGNRGYDWKGLILGRGLAFAAIVLFLTGAVVGTAQAAKPGDGLYTVKVLADKVYAKATGNYETAIQRRADDLIGVSETRPSAVNQAKQEYQNTLNEAKKNAEDSGKRQDLGDVLDQQENKFEDELRNNSGGSVHLEEAISQTEKVKDEMEKGKGSGEVKGVDEGRNNEDDH